VIEIHRASSVVLMMGCNMSFDSSKSLLGSPRAVFFVYLRCQDCIDEGVNKVRWSCDMFGGFFVAELGSF